MKTRAALLVAAMSVARTAAADTPPDPWEALKHPQEKKDWKGNVFTGAPPSTEHDWVLHLSRDGRKEGMAKSYKFESRPILQQEIETDVRLIPYELSTPKAGDAFETGTDIPFSIRLKKTTPGTRRMTYAIAGEVVRDGQGPRVLGTGAEGVLKIPSALLTQPGGVINLRVYGLNAPGKLYALDFVFQVRKKAQ